MTSRIHIIGGPGSGKSYLAQRLSTILSIAPHDLDDLFWDNATDSYGTRNTPEVRDSLLLEILQRSEWIIEGVYHQWVDASFRASETIIVLRPSVWLRDWRILRRFVQRKLGLTKGKRETFGDLVRLLKWNHGYNSDNLRRALSVLEPYKSKMMECHSADDALQFIKQRSQQDKSSVHGISRR